MTPDSREARIEAEAVTDADEDSAWRKYADSIGCDYTAPTVHDDFRAGWNAAEAARKARASNDSGEEHCESCEGVLVDGAWRYDSAGEAKLCVACYDALQQDAPQPAPDRVSRIERLERFASTLAAGVGHGVEAWNSALIAAAEAWNREGE